MAKIIFSGIDDLFDLLCPDPISLDDHVCSKIFKFCDRKSFFNLLITCKHFHRFVVEEKYKKRSWFWEIFFKKFWNQEVVFISANNLTYAHDYFKKYPYISRLNFEKSEDGTLNLKEKLPFRLSTKNLREDTKNLKNNVPLVFESSKIFLLIQNGHFIHCKEDFLFNHERMFLILDKLKTNFYKIFLKSTELSTASCRNCGEFYGTKKSNFLCSACDPQFQINDYSPYLIMNRIYQKNKMDNESFTSFQQLIAKKIKVVAKLIKLKQLNHFFSNQLLGNVLNERQALMLGEFILKISPEINNTINFTQNEIEYTILTLLKFTFDGKLSSDPSAPRWDRKDGCFWLRESLKISMLDPELRFKQCFTFQ
jgi:hypothetical protein